jgi:hypothetical protein
MYIQLSSPNVNIPYVGGLCEGYVEGTVGQATLPTPENPMTYGVYRSASQAWSSMPGTHKELPPPGVRIPVYFSLGNNKDGHTAILMEDGRVATSAKAGYNPMGYIYPSLQAMIDDYAKHNKGCTYLGWSEYIGKLQVVKEAPMGVTIDGAPASVSSGKGNTHVFAKGKEDGKLWHCYYDPKLDPGWSAWEYLDGDVIASAPTASSPYEGRIDVFATSKSGQLLQWYYVDGEGWHGSFNLGQPKG